MALKRFKKDAPAYFDYKDVKTLQRFINIYGQIEPIAKTGLSAKQQRQLAVSRPEHADVVPAVVPRARGLGPLRRLPAPLNRGRGVACGARRGCG